MRYTRIWLVVAVLLTFAIRAVAQQSSASDAELRLLRSTNERLAKENEALKAEVAALRKQLGAGESATRPKALSAGTTGAAEPKKIVFIMDGSGSMLNVFDKLREEVRKSIEDLTPDQSFAVIFDQEGSNNPFPKVLLPATQENKARVLALFPKLFVRGQDKFLTSMKAALAMNPDLIWWRGDDPSTTASGWEEVKNLNVKKVKINASPQGLTLDNGGRKLPEGPLPERHSRTLWFAWKLASENGGTCFDESGQPITTAPPEPPPRPAQPQPNVQLKVDVNRR